MRLNVVAPQVPRVLARASFSRAFGVRFTVAASRVSRFLLCSRVGCPMVTNAQSARIAAMECARG
eukprot:7857021-Lingulodinium_polyedra.AAC.1